MLANFSRHFVFGTDLLILGCNHYNFGNSSYEPKESEIYTRLTEFQPEKILIEISEERNLNTVLFYTDIQSLNAYIQDTDTPYCQYDLPPDLYADAELQDYDLRSETLGDAQKLRQELREHNPRAFEKIAEIREENAVEELVNQSTKHNKIAMHCGMNHMPAYLNYLQFLSEF